MRFTRRSQSSQVAGGRGLGSGVSLPRHSKGLDSTPVCPKRASALPEAYFPPALQALVSALSALTYFPFFASP